MKIYKQILEAINRGIQLALDDFEDNEPNSYQHNDVITTEDVIKQKYDLMKEVVDLGLPSGTLWCKYNLGVDPNKLSKPKDLYGDYYAWGDLEPNKPEFSWNHYKFGKNYDKLTKYCNNHKYGLNGFTDDLTKIFSEDDIAYQNKHIGNYKFHIPTKEQCEELINYTNNYWVKNYDPNKTVHTPEDDGGIRRLNGIVFIGQNGNQLFIPAAGYCNGCDIDDVGFSCNLWSSSLCLDRPNNTYYLYFNSGYVGVSNSSRFFGFSIRPVC